MVFNLYLVIEWGGDGGPDTYLLVRAPTPRDAGRLADERLTMMPFPYAEPRCDRVIELGVDGNERLVQPEVILGPMPVDIGFAPQGYRTWMREPGICDDWRDEREVFDEDQL